jgi:hypothetical protein
MTSLDYWTRQVDKPLFPDAQWNKPERKSSAGRLLIVGGNGFEFAKTQAAYTQALKNGVGKCKVVLPKTANKMIGVMEDIEYVEVTKKGSFSLDSLPHIQELMTWADMVLLPGELGRNSETTLLLEQIIDSMSTPVVVTRDNLELLKTSAKMLLQRQNTSLVLSLAQLQDLMQSAGWPVAIKFQMSLPELVKALHEISTQYPTNFIVYFQTNLIAASGGEVITTKLNSEPEVWRLQTATELSAWQIWTKPKEALATTSWLMKSSLN